MEARCPNSFSDNWGMGEQEVSDHACGSTQAVSELRSRLQLRATLATG
jgi:hypothetical protein